MGPGCFFPTNLDLADILGRMDVDFENMYFLDSKFPDFQVPRFPGPQKSGLGQAWAALGRAWALGRVGPSGAGGPLGRARWALGIFWSDAGHFGGNSIN